MRVVNAILLDQLNEASEINLLSMALQKQLVLPPSKLSNLQSLM
jgi:hypothetical protein